MQYKIFNGCTYPPLKLKILDSLEDENLLSGINFQNQIDPKVTNSNLASEYELETKCDTLVN